MKIILLKAFYRDYNLEIYDSKLLDLNESNEL